MVLDALIVFLEVVVGIGLILGALWLLVTGLGYVEMLVRRQDIGLEPVAEGRPRGHEQRRHVPLPR